MTKKEIEDHAGFMEDFAFYVSKASITEGPTRAMAIAELVGFAYSTGYTHCTKHDAEDNKKASCRHFVSKDGDRVGP